MEKISENSHDVQRLTTVNEELLRSKGKLMQEIIALKKQLEAEEKNRKTIEEVQYQVGQLTTEIAQLEEQLRTVKIQSEEADKEIERLKKMTWYHKLLGRK